MTQEKKERSILLRLVAAVGAFAVIGAGVALAVFVVGSSEPVVLSDDVYNRTFSIVSLTGGPDSTKAKSGFADDSNPAEQSANNKSGKGGTDNPNEAN